MPLSGVRVLDFSWVIAGPTTTRYLAAMGAEVIKIEAPGRGDPGRATELHTVLGQAKKSIALDLKKPPAIEIVRALAAKSDILIENFKVGGLAKFGLDYKSLSPLNPRLIYCSVTGFGQDGPYAPRAGYDLLVQGMGGLMDITGTPDGEPMRVGVPIADLSTGVYSAVGILAALAQRERTGRGSHVDAALLDTQAAVLANQALSYLTTGETPGRIGNTHPVVVPYQVFPVADGHVIIASGNDGQFGKLCTVLGEPGLAKEPTYLTNSDRVQNRDKLIAHLFGLTKKFTRADLLTRLEAVGVPAGPINTLADVFADPQVIARGMRIDPGGVPGVASPIVIDGKRQVTGRPSPARVGEGTVKR